MSEVVVVVLARAQAGKGPEAFAAFSEVAVPTHGEEGCLAYALHSDPDDSDRIVLVERWTSREALDAHLQTPHLLAFRRDHADIWAEPMVIDVLTPFPAGDPAKGLLSGG